MATRHDCTNLLNSPAAYRAAGREHEADAVEPVGSVPSRAGDTRETPDHSLQACQQQVSARVRAATEDRDLQILLQQGEGTTLEYKESLSGSFPRELVALANTRGGKILLGVRDNGTIKGTGDSNSLRARLQDMARNCDPPVLIQVEPAGRVLIVHVEESDTKPVQCREGFFSRQGAVTQKLSRDEICDFFRRVGAVRFDSSIEPRFKYPDDFDTERFEAWRRLSGISSDAPIEEVLVNLEVAEHSRGGLLMRNAGVLFFARKPRRFFSQAYITCILFRGTDRVHIVDRKDFEGGIVADIEASLHFVERNTRTAYRIRSLRRQEIPEYPMMALREAIANAVMHRDWFMYGSNVFVEIHADRVEVVNPGRLFGDVTPDTLDRRCARRNPLIADLLQRIGIIERAGTGIRRMRGEASVHGCPEPAFEADAFFTATFRPLRSMEFEHLRERDIRAHVGAHDEAHVGAHDEREPLSQAERDILLACSEGAVTREYLLRAGGFGSRAGNFKRALSRLLSRGLLEMTIPEAPRSRNQRYRATARGRVVVRRWQNESRSKP